MQKKKMEQQQGCPSPHASTHPEAFPPTKSSPDFDVRYVLFVCSQLPWDKAILWQIKRVIRG